MATPRFSPIGTVSSNEYYPAWKFNTQVRNNLNYLRDHPASVLYRDTNYTGLLASPSEWKGWAWTQETFDDDLHEPGASGNEIALERAGLWLITGNVAFSGGTNGLMAIRLLVNDQETIARNDAIPVQNGDNVNLCVVGLHRTTVDTDTVKLQANSDQAGVRVLGGTNTNFRAVWLGGDPESVTTWTAPTTAATGSYTSARFNTQVKANLETLHGRPSVCAYPNDDVTVSTGTTYGSVALNAEEWDTETLHDNSTNNSRVVLKRVGLWLVTANAVFAESETGRRGAQLYLNGTTAVGLVQRDANASGYKAGTLPDLALHPFSLVYTSTTTDYVELRVYQNSGGDLKLRGGSPEETHVRAVWMGG